MQRFIARERFEFANGAIGYRPGGMMDCLGPYAKVQNCPIVGLEGAKRNRYTAYAQGYADTFFSVPAATRIKGKVIKGYFTQTDPDSYCGNGGLEFRPFNGELEKLNQI